MAQGKPQLLRLQDLRIRGRWADPRLAFKVSNQGERGPPLQADRVGRRGGRVHPRGSERRLTPPRTGSFGHSTPMQPAPLPDPARCAHLDPM
jgi:hypothetical protein